MPPQAPQQGSPASWDDYIQYEAKRQGISPLLALAVAKKESSLNPNAVGDGGQAIGMFQLHPGAAVDTSTANRADPMQNITGGITYLKQLNDRYKGDVNKTLMAYNGGMDNVDKGTISPQAQAYAAEVIADLSKGLRTNATASGAPPPAAQPAPTGAPPPAAGRGTGGTNVGATAKTNVIDFTRAYNPMHQEGRENIAAGIGSLGATALAANPEVGVPLGIAARIYNVLGPIVGASVFGAAENAVEQGISKGDIDSAEVAMTGAKQGAYDLGGQVVTRAAMKIGRTLIAPSVGSHAADAIKAEKEAVAQAGHNAVEAVRIRVHDAIELARNTAREAVERISGTAQAGVQATKQQAASRLADIDLAHATEQAGLAKQLDDLLKAPPSITGTAKAVKETVEGPAHRALNLAGKRVAEAAESGPAIPIKPIQEAIADIASQYRPAEIFGQAPAASAIGYGAPTALPIAARPAAAASGERISIAEYRALLEEAKRTKDVSALPGLLGKIQQISDETIPFDVAHQIKGLLDESVNWNAMARSHIKRITKGARIKVRQTMASAGHQPYEDATAAYAAIAPLYKKGVGKKVLELSQAPEGAAQVAQLLKDSDPINAKALQQLLVDQAAAGGDAAMGLKAWHNIVDTYTYDHLIRGGIDGLGDRLTKLTVQRPEFMRVVYGMPEAAEKLANLGKLADAVAMTEQHFVAQKAGQKAIGETATSAAEDVSQRAVSAVEQRGKAEVRGERHAGALEMRAANRAAQVANKRVREKAALLTSSSLGRRGTMTVEETAANAIRFGALGVHSIFGSYSLLRLLKSPSGSDLVQWAAASPRRTQLVVKVLTSPVPPSVTAALMRELGGSIQMTPPAEQ